MSPPSHARLVLALALLAALATPSWPATVDDVYITLTYARRWADSGVLEWTTGERVEGYSNFLFMAGMALAARLGLDIDLVAQLLAFAAASATLVLLHRRLGPGLPATLCLLALAAWAPLAHWSAIGLETTLYAALLAGGWSLVLRSPSSWGLGMGLLALASVTRPEGFLHFLAGGLTAVRSSPTRGARIAGAASLALLLAYHAVRVTWFGSLAPTSFLVKIAGVGPTRFGVQQWLGDLLTAAGLLGATAIAGRVTGRDLGWVLSPLLIQGATLVSASGDWMSWARLSLPGVVATVGAHATVAENRARVSRTWLGAVAVAVVACSLFEPRGYGTIDLRLRSLSAVARSVANLSHGLDTPVAEDVAWAVDNVPTDASVLAVDVGILGDIPGVRILDMRGLTHRPAAEAVARGEAEGWLRATLANTTSRPQFLRLANWEGPRHPEYPGWLLDGYKLRADLLYGGGSIRWYASSEAAPPAAERASRWDEMLRRHPSQPFLRWRAALSAAADGDLHRAERLALAGARKWPSMAEFGDAPRSLSVVSTTRALTWSPAVGFAVQCGDEAVTRMIQPGEQLSIRINSAEGQTHQGLSVHVEDPCGRGEPPLGDQGRLPICASARQISLSLACGDNPPLSVGLDLVPS